MNPRGPQTLRCNRRNRLLKPATLLKRVLRSRYLRRGEVSQHAIQPQHRLTADPSHQLIQLLARRDALPSHTSIDLQVNIQRRTAHPRSRLGEPLHLLPLPDHRRQPMPHDSLSLGRQQAAHHHNPRLALPRDPRSLQRLTNRRALSHIRNPKPLRTRPCQHRSTHRRAMPVSIRLDHRKHRCLATSGLNQHPVVSRQPSLRNLHPTLHTPYGIAAICLRR